MLTVLLLYRTGGDYDVFYVERLALSIRRNLTTNYQIRCLTDDEPSLALLCNNGILDGTDSLIYGLPGWWSKIELFHRTGPVLYMDLDTVVTGNIDALANVLESMPIDQFAMLRGFYRADQCSGLMGWNGDVDWIQKVFLTQYLPTAKFIEHGNATRMIHARNHFRGDQEWLRMLLNRDRRLTIVMMQNLFNGVCSYKVHAQQELPAGISVVCFHGHPRPHEVHPVPDWMMKHWYIMENLS